jgi:DNA-binding response OmpR family regulator
MTEKRLLIIDDEPAVARVIAKVATRSGYTVTVTTNAEQFTDELIAREPDVIVLDLSMPDTDGVELMRFLASSKCRAKIFIISGFDPRVLETSGKLGAALGLSVAGTLHKPVRVAELRAALAGLSQGSLV